VNCTRGQYWASEILIEGDPTNVIVYVWDPHTPMPRPEFLVQPRFV
jgi:hypothetical protein